MNQNPQHVDPNRIDLQWFAEEGNPGQASGEGAKGAGSFVTNLAPKDTGSGAQPASQEGAQGGQPAGEQGTGKPATEPTLAGWTAGLTKQLKSDPRIASIAKFQTMDDAVNAYLELEGKQGSMVSIPTDKSTPEEIAAFHAKVGVPSKPEEYKLDRNPKIENFDEAQEKEFRQFLHDNHVPQSIAAPLFALVQDRAMKEMQAFQERNAQAFKATESSLRQDWGKEYEANVAIMTRGIARYAPKDFLEVAERTGMGNTKELALLFFNLGSTLREDSAAKGSAGQKAAEKNAAQVLYGGE